MNGLQKKGYITFLFVLNFKGVFWFSTSDFFTNQFSPGPRVSSWGHLEFLHKFAEICNFVFFASVNDTSDKLFTGVNDTGNKMQYIVIVTGDKLSPMSLTLVIKPCSGLPSIPWHWWLLW